MLGTSVPADRTAKPTSVLGRGGARYGGAPLTTLQIFPPPTSWRARARHVETGGGDTGRVRYGDGWGADESQACQGTWAPGRPHAEHHWGTSSLIKDCTTYLGT